MWASWANYMRNSKWHKISEAMWFLSNWVIDQNVQNILLSDLRSAWPTEILMPLLSFLDNLLLRSFPYNTFQISVDNFKIKHKTCSILVWDFWSQLLQNMFQSVLCLCGDAYLQWKTQQKRINYCPYLKRSTDDSPHLQTRPKYTNLPHVKVATIQTCPKYKLAPLYCVWQDTVRVCCIWSSIECVSGSAGNGLGQQTVWSIDRCYVYSVMSIRNRAIIILISYCWTLFYNLTCYHTRSIKLIRESAYTSWSNR